MTNEVEHELWSKQFTLFNAAYFAPFKLKRIYNCEARGFYTPALHALAKNIIHLLVGIISASKVVLQKLAFPPRAAAGCD